MGLCLNAVDEVLPALLETTEEPQNTPRFTVVTPNYNHARYLSKRIDSIQAQTFQYIELLIL